MKKISLELSKNHQWINDLLKISTQTWFGYFYIVCFFFAFCLNVGWLQRVTEHLQRLNLSQIQNFHRYYLQQRREWEFFKLFWWRFFHRCSQEKQKQLSEFKSFRFMLCFQASTLFPSFRLPTLIQHIYRKTYTCVFSLTLPSSESMSLVHVEAAWKVLGPVLSVIPTGKSFDARPEFPVWVRLFVRVSGGTALSRPAAQSLCWMFC